MDNKSKDPLVVKVLDFMLVLALLATVPGVITWIIKIGVALFG